MKFIVLSTPKHNKIALSIKKIIAITEYKVERNLLSTTTFGHNFNGENYTVIRLKNKETITVIESVEQIMELINK